MKIYACSDLHVSPTHFSERARAFLEEAVQQADLTLLCGDIFEGTWCPLEESVKSPNGQELWNLIQKLPKAVIIVGNHDWTLKKHVAESKHPILKKHRFDMDGRSYYATHGWIEYDRSLLMFLIPIYDRIYPLLSTLAKFLKRFKSPRTLKLESREIGGRPLDYWRRVRKTSNQAIFQAIKEGCVPIWGHTHHRHIDTYEEWLAINCGEFCEDEIGGIVIEDGEPRGWQFESA
jgi:UDP-2,3-diacylglucosamine pyrophosphatase LpxH